jgi:predicted small secreted protein
VNGYAQGNAWKFGTTTSYATTNAIASILITGTNQTGGTGQVLQITGTALSSAASGLNAETYILTGTMVAGGQVNWVKSGSCVTNDMC